MPEHPLIQAIQKQDEKSFNKELDKVKRNINAVTHSNGMLPLQFAVSCGNLPAVQRLLYVRLLNAQRHKKSGSLLVYLDDLYLKTIKHGSALQIAVSYTDLGAFQDDKESVQKREIVYTLMEMHYEHNLIDEAYFTPIIKSAGLHKNIYFLENIFLLCDQYKKQLEEKLALRIKPLRSEKISENIKDRKHRLSRTVITLIKNEYLRLFESIIKESLDDNQYDTFNKILSKHRQLCSLPNKDVAILEKKPQKANKYCQLLTWSNEDVSSLRKKCLEKIEKSLEEKQYDMFDKALSNYHQLFSWSDKDVSSLGQKCLEKDDAKLVSISSKYGRLFVNYYAVQCVGKGKLELLKILVQLNEPLAPKSSANEAKEQNLEQEPGQPDGVVSLAGGPPPPYDESCTEQHAAASQSLAATEMKHSSGSTTAILLPVLAANPQCTVESRADSSQNSVMREDMKKDAAALKKLAAEKPHLFPRKMLEVLVNHWEKIIVECDGEPEVIAENSALAPEKVVVNNTVANNNNKNSFAVVSLTC